MFLLAWLLILAMIAVNAFFVAAEFAAVSVRHSRIRSLAGEGNRLARLLLPRIEDPASLDRYVACCQVGITFSSLLLGAVGQASLTLQWAGFAGWVGAHAAASVLAITTLAYLHIVLGEMVPKSLALQKPESTALWLIRSVQWTQFITFPLVIMLSGLGNLMLSMIGIRRAEAGHERYYTTEELQYVVRESQQGGLLRAESGRVLSDLLEFGEITAGEVMVPRTKAVGVPADAAPEVIKNIVRSSRHTRYPVFEKDLDHILGVVHIKELFQALLADVSVPSKTLHPVPRVPEGLTLDRVMEAMREAGAQMVIVMDEHGGTAGILTMEDLFQEIVGDIEEASGPTSHSEIFRDEQGVLYVDGSVRLPAVGEHLGIELEHDEVDSVSGLVLLLLGCPAVVGDEVEYEGFVFKVTQIDGHGVGQCKVTQPSQEPDAVEE